MALALVVVGVSALSGTKPMHPIQGRESTLRVGTLPEDICPEVTVRLGYNPHVQQRELEFYVVNRECATNGIRIFAVEKLPRAMATNYPPQWMSFYGFDGRDSVIVWGCIDTLTPPPPGSTGNLYPSPYEIQPGDTMHFVALVPSVPPTLRFYAQGFDTIPDAPEPIHSIYEYGWTGEVTLDVTAVASAKRPRLIEFGRPAPNPTSAFTTISFALPVTAHVNLAIFDVRGAIVKKLMDRRAEPGTYAVTWDGRDEHGRATNAGAYFARFVVDGKRVGSQKVVVLK